MTVQNHDFANAADAESPLEVVPVAGRIGAEILPDDRVHRARASLGHKEGDDALPVHDAAQGHVAALGGAVLLALLDSKAALLVGGVGVDVHRAARGRVRRVRDVDDADGAARRRQTNGAGRIDPADKGLH